MAGELVPLVLLPRYTTYSGKPAAGPNGEPVFFSTVAMDVTQYETAIVSVWRGKLNGATTPGVQLTFQESVDQVTWTTCGGTTANFDPGENTETKYNAALTKRWFRIIVQLGGADNYVTCWAVGFLELRQS